MIVEVLRRLRTAALWLASPAASTWRRLRGKPALPPLWLRRHTGPLASFEDAAREAAEFLDRLQILREGDLVLDIGCGAGAMVPEIARRLGPRGRYVGFDVHASSIRWCLEHYAGDPRLSFVIALIGSPYGSPSGPPLGSFRFPVEGGEADLVLAKSIFTHLLEADARHYLAETRRVLRPGRAAVVTAFLFDRSRLASVRRAFPFEGTGGLVRLRSRARPTAAVAYEKALFVRMIEDAGLRVQWLSAGYFPGASHATGQDTLLLGH